MASAPASSKKQRQQTHTLTAPTLPKTENPFLSPMSTNNPAKKPNLSGQAQSNQSTAMNKKTIKKQYIWKPGHGTIEKVDKRTGEIFHLAENTQQIA